MQCEQEFPEFTLDVEIPAGFSDESWHNDAMPSFVREFDNGRTLTIFVDYAERAKSDYSEREDWKRFSLFMGSVDGIEEDPIVYTDDWDEVLIAIEDFEFSEVNDEQRSDGRRHA